MGDKEKIRNRTAWKNSTTTVSTPRSKNVSVSDPKAMTDRVNKRAAERKALKKMDTTKKPTTPQKTTTKKAVTKPTTDATTSATAKPVPKDTTPKATEKELAALLKQQGEQSITTTSLGVGGIEGNANLANQYQESVNAEQQQAQINQPQAGGQQDPLAPLPPAEELPPDAPLWLKMIRGVLTPVPPLAMIPHMFIQGMEQKRAAAQADDNKNMEYFWDMYDRNPIGAAELAKTPLFRDTLQRKHGFTAQDLQDIQEAAAGQPFKSSEYAQMIGQGVVDRGEGQSGMTVGERKLGKEKKPIQIQQGARLYDPDTNKLLYDAADADRQSFHEINKKTNKDATQLESMLLQKAVSGNQAKVKWMVAGDKLVAYDATIPYQQMIKDKAYSIFNNKNKGKSEVTVAKDNLGGTIGLFITDVENPKPVLDEQGNETGEIEYPNEFISLDQVLLDSLKSKYGDQAQPDPAEVDNFLMTTYMNVMKSLGRSIGGDVQGNEVLSNLVKQSVLEEFYKTGGRPAEGHGGTGGTTTTVSPEVQQYYE